MSYQSSGQECEAIEELRRTVAELRAQLERECQRRVLVEHSYTYSLMAAQTAKQPALGPVGCAEYATQQSQIPTTVITTPPSPPQSRHGSTDEVSWTKTSIYAG